MHKSNEQLDEICKKNKKHEKLHFTFGSMRLRAADGWMLEECSQEAVTMCSLCSWMFPWYLHEAAALDFCLEVGFQSVYYINKVSF